jgi:lipoyl(octanoyl) transferase
LQREDLRLKQIGSTKTRWETAVDLVPYDQAVQRMTDEAERIYRGEADDLVWLLEHPPIYTAGTSAKDADLINPLFPVHSTGRGGQYTYHGPGQRIAYTMMDLRARGNDVRSFVAALENWIIRTLDDFGIVGERHEERVGVWVQSGSTANKIAALGIRVKRGVSLHGISLNVNPDLSHYSGIVPCGLPSFGVTSLHALGIDIPLHDIDVALKRNFDQVFHQ